MSVSRIGVPVGAALVALLASAWAANSPHYAWHPAAIAAADTLTARFPPPSGFEREAVPPGSFAEWLRGLPIKPPGTPVLLYDSRLKSRQDVHAAVVDIDTGTRDLQQCADALMRLRAEWLYAANRANEIAFNNTDGPRIRFAARGETDYASFRKFMDYLFAYAGTYSLEHELKPVAKVEDVRIGDVFIRGGFPGHAVLVVDLAVNPTTGEKRFLLLQSFMPAQDMHVLNNPSAADGSPWYETTLKDNTLITPEWTFDRSQLRRWP